MTDDEMATIWQSIARSRRTEAAHTRDDVARAGLLTAADHAECIAKSLLSDRDARLEELFWRSSPPTEVEKRSLGLNDVLWPEQLKQAHRNRVQP